jgi:hypothetical protein
VCVLRSYSIEQDGMKGYFGMRCPPYTRFEQNVMSMVNWMPLGQLRKLENKPERAGFWRLHALEKGHIMG